MPIESCSNFARFVNPRTKEESQWCKGALKNVECAGWSDMCRNKEYFIPTGRIPISEVSFEKGGLNESRYNESIQ